MAEFRGHSPEFKDYRAGVWAERRRKVAIAGVITVPALATATALLSLAFPITGTVAVAGVAVTAVAFTAAFGVAHFLKRYNEGGAQAGRKYQTEKIVVPRDVWIKD